jgi:hypothetical protein
MVACRHIYITRLLVVNDAGATATIISFRLPFLTEPSAPTNPSTYRVPPRPWMVARDSSRIFFSRHSRSARLAYTQYAGKARIKRYLDYILSSCTPNSLVSAKKNGKPAAPPAPAPSKLDPSVRVLPSLRSTLTVGVTFDYTQSHRTWGSPVFLPYARQPRDDARMLS